MRPSSKAPFFILGPCVIEERDATLRIAQRLAEEAEERGVEVVFKASFDKANRSQLDAYRGPGLEEGLRVLEAVRAHTGLRLCTDVHAPEQAAPAAEIVDVIQVPAFLCRQTDLLVAAAATGRVVHVKKGQFMAPWDMSHVVDKLVRSGAPEVWLCERGAAFGYGELVVDPRSFVILSEITHEHGGKVVYDATHALQTRSPGQGATAGERRFALPLVRAAVAVGVDAIFAEVHPEPEHALSDAATQWPLARVGEIFDAAYSKTPLGT